MNPAPAARCRVLELGCGAGGNLIPLALGLPESTFVGIDLSAAEIARGQALLAKAGAGNITLRQGDIRDGAAELGTFDYIIAHGVYAWVPLDVRERLMEICAAHLTEQGIAFISYNVYPGGYIRRMVREILLYHTRSCSTARERLERGKELLAFLAEGSPRPERYREIIREELRLLARHGGDYYLHDNLSEYNYPVYFHEFIAHARQHRLQYLTDLNCSVEMDRSLSPLVVQELRRLSGGQRIELEQYGDFFECRLFRQTLLCRDSVPLDGEFNPARIERLLVQSPARPLVAQPDLAPGAIAKFKTPGEAEVETGHPLAKAALCILGEKFPQALPFPELVEQARSRLGRAGSGTETEPEVAELAEFLFLTDAVHFVKLLAHVPPWVTTLSERPCASPLVRWQAAAGFPITNVWYQPMKIEDPLLRHFLGLLDGTRDRAALVDELAAFMRANAIFVKQGDEPITDPQRIHQLLAGALETNLANFARLCLLVG
jgi:SAM-dependent methyltransferase